MARNKKVEILSHDGQVLHPITDGDCVIFPDGETLARKLSEQEEVMYTPEVVNSSPMFKVGEGNSSDYSANVLDGAYQEAVLKGQTYVNTIQEPSADVITLPTPFTEYERTQSKTFKEMQDGTFGLNLVGQSYVNCIQEPSEPSYVALGENLEFQNKKVEYTTNGQIKSAMLNGQTLVNLATITSFSMTARGSCSHFVGDMTLTPNTYTVIADIEVLGTGTCLFGFYEYFGQSRSNTKYFSKSGKYIWTENISNPNIASYGFYTYGETTGATYTLNNLVILEGDHTQEDIPYFQGMQSVTMTTELENVCSRYNSSGAKNGKTFTVGTWENRGLTLSTTDNIAKYNFKPNTKYLVQFKVTNLNLDGLSSISIAFSDGEISTGNSLFGDNALVEVKSNGIYRGILTTSNVISTSNFVIKGLKNQWENSTSTTRKLTISQIMCIEYQNGMENWDLPYFETTQLMKPLKVQSINKNLCPTMTIGGIYDTTGLEFAKTDLLRSDFIKLNSTLTISSNNVFNRIFGYDKNKKFVQLLYTDATGTTNRTIGATSGIEFIRIRANYVDNFNIQIEESSTATDYAPHQSKTTSALEPITLRAIGDVKDTLDLSTGEYVQRIGEIEFDGSDDERWMLYDNSTTNTISFRTTLPNGKTNVLINTEKYLCDKFPVLSQGTALNNKETEWTFYNLNGMCIVFFSILRSKLTTEDLVGFKNYISQNPIKVQYELANPITRKISLEYPNLQTYQDITHVQSIAMDGTLIPKIYLPSDISYKAMLKPNTSYNVIVDREVIDSTNQLTVNLGGTTANITANKTVVRTPSTLSNETLTFSGKDNRLAKVMLIEGSTLINGDLPHFEGIGDVHLGRVVENLCLANEIVDGNGRTTDTYSNNSITSKFTASGSRVYLFNLIKPIQNGKKYFVYAPCSRTCAIGFKTIYNGASLYSVAKTSIDNYTILSIDNEILRECKLFIGQLGAMPVDTTMTIRRPIICEYIDGMENWDWESIGYFTGTRNIGNEFMRIGNKNLFDWNSFKEKIKNESCFTILDNGFTADCSKGAAGSLLANKYRLAEGIFKENTQYTISFDTTHEGNLYISPTVVYTDGTHEGISIGGNGKRILTSAINKTVKAFSVTWLTQDNGGKSTLTNIQLEKATSATSYVAHKHNSLHILPNEQIPLTFVQGAINYAKGDTWANAINNTYNIRIRTQLLNLEPNETYRISCGNNGYNFAVYSYDNSSLGTSGTGWLGGEYYISTTKDINKIAITIRKPDDSNITPSVLHQVRLEKVTDVTLRSVGDVKDELDLTRGVYIQRIGEVVLNGSENWKVFNDTINPDNYTNSYRTFFVIPRGSMGISANCKLYSDKYKTYTQSPVDITEKGFIYAGNTNLNVVESANMTVNEFRNKISLNPITIQYQLETPIEHKINIPMKNESNQTIAKPNGIFTLPLMYSETNHVDINSQIYPKVQSRDYISYPVIASPSNKYTVFHNKVGSTDLTVNLCGTSTTVNTHKNTITTPSSISQYELRLSGANNKVSNVCVFNGDYMNVNVPYVQGMMNAVNPTVKNVGENLLDNEKLILGGIVWTTGEDWKGTDRRRSDYLRVKPNTRYVISFHNCSNANTGVGEYDISKTFVCSLLSGNGKNDIIFTTKPSTYFIRVVTPLDGKTLLKESSTPSQYEPYKENICYVDCGEIRLTPDMFEQGNFGSDASKTYEENKATATNRYRVKTLVKVEPNTTYNIRYTEHDSAVFEYGKDEKKLTLGYNINKSTLTITTSNNCYYLAFNFVTSILPTQYVSIIKVSEIITLRSLPNGVRDELNLQTGEYIQRIGEVVLDGNIDPSLITNINKRGTVIENRTSLYTKITINEATTQGEWAIKTTPTKFTTSRLVNDTTNAYYALMPNTVAKSDGSIQICIDTDLLEAETKDGVIKYLSENPVTYIGELKTPIVKQINIHNYPHSHQNGHVIVESGDTSTNVTAQMTYQCVANRSGQIQEHTEQVEKQERQINELETLILENIRQNQNRSQNFLTSLISTLEIEEE